MGTLYDELKKLSLGTKEIALFKHIFKNDPFLGALPAKRIAADPYFYQREATRPPVGPVGSEGEFPEGKPTFSEHSVKLKRIGGQIPFDDLDINKTSDLGDPRATLTEQLALATIEEVGRLLIYGDEAANALHWTGVKEIVEAGPASQMFDVADAAADKIALRDFWKAESLLKIGKQGAFYMGHPSMLPTIKDKFAGDTSAAEKMLPNFGRPVFHIGPYPFFENDHMLVNENDAGTGSGSLGSIYLIGAGPQAFTALIPNRGELAARILTIGPRERKAGSIIRAEIQLGFALHSAYSVVRIHGIDPAK